MLPLVPGYLSAVSGVSPSDLDDAGWRRVLVPSLFFVASFSAIFIFLGLTATGLGFFLRDNEELLSKISAALIILMGFLFIASLFVARLNREWHVEALLARAGKGGPIVAGAAFAIAWTPCIGPTLSAILSLAAQTNSAGKGAFLLAVYSAGLAIPFLLTAIAFSQMTSAFEVVKRHYQVIVAVGGVILIAMGVLIWTDELTRINAEVQSWSTDRPRLLELLVVCGRAPRSQPRCRSPRPLRAPRRRDRASRRCGSARCRAPGPAAGQAADLVPAQPLDLERVHPHLRRREGAVGVVLVDRLRDRLEILGLRRCHRNSLGR